METTLVDGQLRFMHGYRTSMEGTKRKKRGSGSFRYAGGNRKSSLLIAEAKWSIAVAQWPIRSPWFMHVPQSTARGLFPYLSTCPVIIAIIHPGLTRHSYKNIDPLLLFLPPRRRLLFLLRHLRPSPFPRERGERDSFVLVYVSSRGKWRNVGLTEPGGQSNVKNDLLERIVINGIVE